MFAEEDTANSQRQAKIQQLMKEDDSSKLEVREAKEFYKKLPKEK